MKQQPVCVISFGYQHFVVSAEEGVKMFTVLSSAKAVETEYNGAVPYKFGKSESITMKHLPWEDYTKMCELRDALDALKE